MYLALVKATSAICMLDFLNYTNLDSTLKRYFSRSNYITSGKLHANVLKSTSHKTCKTLILPTLTITDANVGDRVKIMQVIKVRQNIEVSYPVLNQVLNLQLICSQCPGLVFIERLSKCGHKTDTVYVAIAVCWLYWYTSNSNVQK